MDYNLIRLCDSVNPGYDISRVDSGSPQVSLPSENNTDERHERTYTMAEAFNEAVQGGYRIIIYVPNRKFYYLKGRNRTIEEARNTIFLKPGQTVCCILNF